MRCVFVTLFSLFSSTAFSAPNPLASDQIIYEVQVRAANACHPAIGSRDQQAACIKKIAPIIENRGEETQKYCDARELSWLNGIKLGTFEDMLVKTADYRQGITLDYIQHRVGANTIWLMPLFPIDPYGNRGRSVESLYQSVRIDIFLCPDSFCEFNGEHHSYFPCKDRKGDCKISASFSSTNL